MMPPSFLQSAEWEAFERSLGRVTRRIGGVLMARRALPMGFHYWYCPRPPRLTGDFFTAARKIAKQERSIFLKIDPMEKIAPDVFDNAGGAIRPGRAIQPTQSIILDLDKTEDEILGAMHEKTRYNIRLAERKGVSVRRGSSKIGEKDGKIFWGLLQETASRDGFRTHPRGYYEKLLKTRSDYFSNELFFAEYQGEILAAALINFYAPPDTPPPATYLHGASAPRHRAVMAPHLLQWRIIQEAKKRGCRYYDFWGIDERKWSGVTRFKRGFGGREIAYPPSMDIVYRPAWYAVYRMMKKVWNR